MTLSNPETDSLKVIKNADGTFEMVWDKNDPTWAFLNHMTSKEIEIIMKQAIEEYCND